MSNGNKNLMNNNNQQQKKGEKRKRKEKTLESEDIFLENN